MPTGPLSFVQGSDPSPSGWPPPLAIISAIVAAMGILVTSALFIRAARALRWEYSQRRSLSRTNWLSPESSLMLTDNAGSTYGTTITAADARSFTALAPLRNGDIVPLAVGDAYHATVTGVDAVYHFRTRIQSRQGGAGASLTFDMPERWEREQRRCGLRVRLFHPISAILTHESTGSASIAWALDLSDGGALLRTAESWPKGELVKIAGLEVESAPCRPFHAKVVSCEPRKGHFTTRVSFIGMDEAEELALRDFVYDAHRRAIMLG